MTLVAAPPGATANFQQNFKLSHLILTKLFIKFNQSIKYTPQQPAVVIMLRGENVVRMPHGFVFTNTYPLRSNVFL